MQVYGFHAPMHQDHVRYASIALRGGEDSIMEPDLLAVRATRHYDKQRLVAYSSERHICHRCEKIAV